MEIVLTKPYLKPGGFSEPVVAMKKFFNSTQTKHSTNNSSSTLRSKSSLLSKQFDRCNNNFSFDQIAHPTNKAEPIPVVKLKKSLIKGVLNENNNNDYENCLIYSIKPEYSKKVLMYSLNKQNEFNTERNERPKRIYGNLSVDNRRKKPQTMNKNLSGTNNSYKVIEPDQINNNENYYYKENIGLRGQFF